MLTPELNSEGRTATGALVAQLIERLEKATDADRELDIEIFEAFADNAARTDRRGVMRVNLPGYDNAAYMRSKCPFYTSSIDAALTLVPKGYRGSIGICGNPITALWQHQEPSHQTTHRNPAIALCIAALKARTAS